MSEFWMVFISIIVSFLIGSVSMLFLGGSTTLKYLVTKASFGRKVLVFADTQTGRRVFIGKLEGDKKRGVVSWKLNGSLFLTETETKNFGRYYAVNYIACNADAPTKAYDLSVLGELPIKIIDPEVYNNICLRLITAPVSADMNAKLMKIAFFVLLALAGGIVMIYLKVVDVHKIVSALGVI